MAGLPNYSVWRLNFSWFCYIAAPAILLFIALTFVRESTSKTKWLLVIPELINIFVVSTAFFSKWCFYFDAETNLFIDGNLVSIPRYLPVLYLTILLVLALKNLNKNRWESIIIISAVFFVLLNILCETVFHLNFSLREITIAISLLAYFMYFTLISHFAAISEIDAAYAENEERNNKELVDQCIETLAYTIDAKDKYTKGHSSRVAKYSRMIAQLHGMSEEDCRMVYLAGLLHDIGKISINDLIINKPGKLSEDEYEQIKKHPANGAVILAKMKRIPYIIDGAKYHHERYDGKGYPNGFKEEEIPELARIIAVADAYDAMTSYRSYRKVMDQSDVKQEIWKGMGTQFDPHFAKIMISLIDADPYYEMREKQGEDDEISIESKDVEIAWISQKPKRIEGDTIQKTGHNSMADLVCHDEQWGEPRDKVLAEKDAVTVNFIGISREDAKYIWCVPTIIIYSSEDGKLLGKNYEELSVLISAGYGWRAGSCLRNRYLFSQKDSFENWNNWMNRHREGIKYSISIEHNKNEIAVKIENDLCKIDETVFLPETYDKPIYFAFTGEKCDITGI